LKEIRKDKIAALHPLRECSWIVVGLSVNGKPDNTRLKWIFFRHKTVSKSPVGNHVHYMG
jgi:hypothetical protein